MDECALGLHECDTSANITCVDTRFYYKCECLPGFKNTGTDDNLICEGKAIARLISDTSLHQIRIFKCI